MAETGRVVGTDTTGVAVFVDTLGFERAVGVIGDAVAANTAAVDANGNLKVIAALQYGSRTAQTITTATAQASVAVAGYGSVIVDFTPTALTGFAAVFQLSTDGGTTWSNVVARNLSVQNTVSATNSSSSAALWLVPCAGATHFRLSVSSITGTNMVAGILPTAFQAQMPNQNTVGTSTSGGAGFTRVIATASTNATNVKAFSGSLYNVVATNLSAAVKYVRLYNKSTTPAPATDNGVIFLALAIPTGATVNIPFNPVPLAFTSGLGFDITGGAADTDATATAAGDVSLTLTWA